MKRCAAAVLLFLLLMTFTVAAQQNDDKPAKAMADSVNRFGLDLYQTIPASGGNRFFSPYSIAAALGMTREGAAGDTAAEMDDVFHFPGKLASHQVALRKALTPRMVEERSFEARKVVAYELEIANALWGQEGKEFVPEFLQTLEREYVAPLERIDFRQGAAARQRINGWVAEKTHDKIKDILQPPLPTPDTRLAIANAIYFKASWADQFQEGRTKKTPFYELSGKSRVVGMMHHDDESFGYAEDGDVQVVEIPYRGDDTSMVLIVPRKRDGLPGVEKDLSHEKLTGWLGNLSDEKVDLGLPRFQFSVPLDLTAILPEMGMPRAFSADQADFSGMSTKEPLYIGAVLHKAYIGVDEKGTEAAAATVVFQRFGALANPPKPKVVLADHPFLFLIRERKTGCILFMGRLMAP